MKEKEYYLSPEQVAYRQSLLKGIYIKKKDRNPPKVLSKGQVFVRSWETYKKTNEYKRMYDTLEDAGIPGVNADNIIYRIYYSGYFRIPFIQDQKDTDNGNNTEQT